MVFFILEKVLLRPKSDDFFVNFCALRVSMEFDCHTFLKHIVFEMKNLAFRSEILDFFRKTRYFKSKF